MLACILIVVIAYTFLLSKKLLQEKMEYYREIPNNESPAIIGKMIKGHTDGNDIIATILSLQKNGYIRIEKEDIKGKEKKVLYLERNVSTTELKEHEIFLINRIFRNNSRVVFEEYIDNSNFKNDFKTFDKMLDRRIERKTIYNNSNIKNINKILLLLIYFIFGICILFAITSPIVLGLGKIANIQIKTLITVSIIVSAILHLFISYKYITFVETTTNARENINLNIVYIILSVIIGFILIFMKYENIYNIFYEEIYLYKIILNFIIAIITILYMFNIVKHTDRQEYLYYIFSIISIVSIIFNFKLTMGICIIFFIVYIFFKSPKHNNLKERDEIYKWIALKRYLEDYSLLSEQDTNAILIWEEYLVYAIALGVNKKILKKYVSLNDMELLNEVFAKKIYVEYFE